MDVRPGGRGGRYRIADFICPTEETRAAFGVVRTVVKLIARPSKTPQEDAWLPCANA
jgi:hypothetical protein